MAQKTEECKPLVVVRIRGTVSAQREARETLDLLHLTHTNHAVIIDSRPAYKGMLQRINSYITYGEPTKETVAMMIQKRALLSGDKKLTEEYLTKIGYKISMTSQKQSSVTKYNTANSQMYKHASDCIHQAKDTKAKPKKASMQAAKQATAEKQSTH